MGAGRVEERMGYTSVTTLTCFHRHIPPFTAFKSPRKCDLGIAAIVKLHAIYICVRMRYQWQNLIGNPEPAIGLPHLNCRRHLPLSSRVPKSSGP